MYLAGRRLRLHNLRHVGTDLNVIHRVCDYLQSCLWYDLCSIVARTSDHYLMQSDSAQESGNSVAALAIDHSPLENDDAALDIAEGSEGVGDIASDRNQQGSHERRPQTSRAPTNRNKRRGWSAIEISTLALLHAIHGNKWSVIARHYRNRHDGDVKNIFHSALRSKATETNCLLRAYAQTVGPNCDDPRVRQSAYEAARQQYGSAPILSSAAAYLNQQAISLADDKDPDAVDPTTSPEAFAEAGPSQPQQTQPQPRQQQLQVRTPGLSNRQGKAKGKEAAEEDQGQGSEGPQPAAEVGAPPAGHPRRSRRLARSAQPSDASASAPLAAELPADPSVSAPTDWESDGGGAVAAAMYSPSHDVLLQLRARRDANASLERKAPGVSNDNAGLNLEVKQAWGPVGTDGHPDRSLLAPQRSAGIVWGQSALDAAHPHMKRRQQQQEQEPSLLHRASVLHFPRPPFAPPQPQPQPQPQPKSQSPHSRHQHVSCMEHDLAGDAVSHGPLYGGGHGIGSSAVSMYGNMGLPVGGVGITASYPGAAPRPSTHMLAPQQVLAPSSLSTMLAAPQAMAVGPSADPNSANPLGLSNIGHTIAAPYPSHSVFGGGDGAGFRSLTAPGTTVMPPPGAGALRNTQRLASAAAGIRDPDIVSMAGASSGGVAATAGSGGSQQLDPLEALLRDLESPFTSAASLLGRTRPVESSNPLRLLRRPRLPVDPLSMPGPQGLPGQSATTGLAGSMAPPGAPGAHGQLGAGPPTLLGSGQIPLPASGQPLVLAPSGSGQMAQWATGGHAAAARGQMHSAYPALGSAGAGGGAFHSTVSRGSGLMGQQLQGLYDTWVSTKGLAPVPSTGIAAPNRISPPPGPQPFMLPSGGGGGGASAMPPLGASFTSWAPGAFVFTGAQGPVDPAVDYLRTSGVNPAAYSQPWPGTGAGGGAADSYRANAGMYASAPTAAEGPHLVDEQQRRFWESTHQQVPLQQAGSLSGSFTPGAPVTHQGTGFRRELGQLPQPPGDGHSGQGPFGLQ
ncbi:hypothetical protein VaNZ11_014607 [Volvox africanus]|uniref:Myb-like domain-containing protein n=1 Tax=Volvox africanus TaxID=51714 RepID=A0ABQ5SK71_9CHLO|nr:hypothetical protein VaNZ11_014607 [Volvox africanus]